MRICVLILALGLLIPVEAEAAEYNSRQAGHPLRVAAYLLHPVGVVLDWVIFRPAWHLAQYEPVATLVGMDTGGTTEADEDEIPNPFIEP